MIDAKPFDDRAEMDAKGRPSTYAERRYRDTVDMMVRRMAPGAQLHCDTCERLVKTWSKP